MNDQPKPASGEWTFRDVYRDNHYSIWQGDTCIAQDVEWHNVKTLVEYHNATLAELRESRDRWNQWCHNAQEQLAAEREKTDNATENCMSLSKLLYADREKREMAEEGFRLAEAARAAEREKVKELEDELNEAVKLLKLADIDAAIAKIKK